MNNIKHSNIYLRIGISAVTLTLLIASVGVLISLSIPGSLTMHEGEQLKIGIVLPQGMLDIKNNGCNLEQANDGISITASRVGNYNLGFSIFGMPVKSATIKVVKPLEVIPGGNTIGIKMCLKGVLVVGLSELVSEIGPVSPGKESGIMAGDVITCVNGGKITSGNDLSLRIKDSGGEEVRLSIERDGKMLDKIIRPVYQKSMREYKIGVWVKDSAAGIGTLTFTSPDSGAFAALGHGISDADTGTKFVIDEGEITGCDVTSIVKGEKGAPGEIKGVFKDSIDGQILSNSDNGIYGYIKDNGKIIKTIPVASCSQVHKGDAVIYSNIENDKVESFSIEILKVMSRSKKSTKGMVIKVTDKRLLEITGGIVQGMSGSPIIQEGALVGAVTHVFVNDPTKGYGVFAEWMMEGLQNAKTDVMY